jgi:hypothetical protein
MTVESRQLQLVNTGSGASDPGPFRVAGRREHRTICDRCGTSSPWQADHPEFAWEPTPAWFVSQVSNDPLTGPTTTHLCGFCAGGGGTLSLPEKGTIWWSPTRPRSVGKVVTADALGGVSVSVVYTPDQSCPSDKRLRPIPGAIVLPAREFYAAWEYPKPEEAILSPRTVWIDFARWETVTLEGAEYLGGNDYLVCFKGERTCFRNFVQTHVPTGARLPRSRYQRLLEDHLDD